MNLTSWKELEFVLYFIRRQSHIACRIKIIYNKHQIILVYRLLYHICYWSAVTFQDLLSTVKKFNLYFWNFTVYLPNNHYTHLFPVSVILFLFSMKRTEQNQHPSFQDRNPTKLRSLPSIITHLPTLTLLASWCCVNFGMTSSYKHQPSNKQEWLNFFFNINDWTVCN